jgi:chitinase
VTYKSATPSTGGSCANVSGTVKCDFPSIANGASKTVTIVVTPTSTTSDLSNTATVTSASADANPANNSATSHTQVVADQPQISIDDPTSIPEGDSGTKNLTFTISIDKTSGSDVTVHYATSNGTATQPADYTSTSGTATITAGQTSTTVDVPIVGDTLDENDETLHVDLTSPTGALILDNQGTGTIIDDDGPPSASVGDTSVIEGTGGTTTMHVPVTLSAASGKTVTVDYATSAGTAATGTDYTTTTGTLTFNPGDTSKTIDVPIVTDSIDESDETFTVTLTNPSNTTIADSSGTETIIDDDTTTVPPVTPTLSIGDATVNPEGNSGTTNATFTVTLSSASLSVVTVNYATSNGTATAPGDYTAASGTLTFSPGDTSKTVTVAVVGDTVPEPDETFTVGLSTPSGATIADGSGLGTIVDDDQLGGGGSVGGGDLFCGVQHRGKCKGLPVKDEFDRPGNAVWVFAAYNPPPGKTRAHTAAARPIVLGQVRRKVAKGKVSFVFKLKPGKKTKQLYKRVKKAKLKGVLITRTFTPADGGAAERVTKSVKLKR